MAKTTAQHLSEVSRLWPYTHTVIIGAVMAEWLWWEVFPSLPIIAGTPEVIGSNLLINWRETPPSPAGTVDPYVRQNLDKIAGGRIMRWVS